MRRLLVLAVLVALAVPATSTARTSGPNDGTLSVRDARGTITISGRGGVIGSFARGSVTIVDPVGGDGSGPIVTGDERTRVISETTTTWGGVRVRFRIIGGAFKIRVQGKGIFLSLVGRGTVTLKGAGTENDGMSSVNGEAYEPIPDFPFTFFLSAISP